MIIINYNHSSRIVVGCPKFIGIIPNLVEHEHVLESWLFKLRDLKSVFVQDNAPSHKSRSTLTYLVNKHACLLADWPSQLSDINVIKKYLIPLLWYPPSFYVGRLCTYLSWKRISHQSSSTFIYSMIVDGFSLISDYFVGTWVPRQYAGSTICHRDGVCSI